MLTRQTIYREMAKRLPGWSKDLVRPLVWNLTRATFAPPVAQMYICNEEIETFLGINNFFSLLSPTQETEVKIKITIYESSGRFIGSVEREGQHFSGLGVRVSDLLKNFSSHSTSGLISCQMVPTHPRRALYKPLGICASHFFVFYRSVHGSVGHIHPSSVLDDKNAPSAPFVSNQSISSLGLRKISLCQLNPCRVPVEVEHQLIALPEGISSVGNSVVISRKVCQLAPFETKWVKFEVEKDFVPKDHVYLTIGVSPLPSANSKPLLFRYYEGMHFSVSHS